MAEAMLACQHPSECRGCSCRWKLKMGRHSKTGIERAASFWRSRGARRLGLTELFCISLDQTHPSHSLPATEDPGQPGKDFVSAEALERGIYTCSICEDIIQRINFDFNTPMQTACRTLSDSDLLRFLQRDLANNGVLATTSALEASGPTGTCYHIAAELDKLQTVKWMMETFRSSVHSALDNAKVTALVSKIYRMHIICRDKIETGDDYHGNSEASSRCLLLLMGNDDPSMEELDQVRHGCFCEECVEGLRVSSRVCRAVSSPTGSDNSQ